MWYIYPLVLPVRGASRQVINEVLPMAQQVREFWNHVPIFGGEVTGGLVAKFIAYNIGAWAIPIESPVYRYSFFDFLGDDEDSSAAIHVVNAYASNSLFSFREPGIASNVRLPSYQGLWRPRNPYQSLCLILAGCTQHSDYDDFCREAVGMDTFMDYFKEWQRPRVP
jgi:hypothetical protein